MKIANKVAFGTIAYCLKGDVQVNIKLRKMGYWKEEIFVGTMSQLWERENQNLRWRLEQMQVNAIHVEGDVLFVGVDQ